MARTSLVTPAIAAGPGEWSARHETIHIDIGTGDGRYALDLARREPSRGVVGLDTNLDHLVVHPRRMPANLRFIAADARSIPPELAGRAATLSINFPSSGLLTGLLGGDVALLASLATVLAPGGRIDVRVNARALVEEGVSLTEAGSRVERALRLMGLVSTKTTTLGAADLRCFPSTWAKRAGFGRDPHAVEISGRSCGYIVRSEPALDSRRAQLQLRPDVYTTRNASGRD